MITDGLWQRYGERRDADTRRLLLEQYLGLVHHAAHEISRPNGVVELEDLIGAGTLGLIQAVEGFDPARGVAFSSYAMPRIRGAMRDELRAWDGVPRTTREHGRTLRGAADELRQRLGREPEAREVAGHLGLPMDTYWRRRDRAREPQLVPLDGGAGADPDLAEVLPDTTAPDPLARLEEREVLDGLATAVDELPERERLILILSYYEELTLKQIGELLEITESRVSQLRSRALGRLEARLEPREKAA